MPFDRNRPKPSPENLPLFYGKKEQAFANSLMAEQLETVVKQTIFYYLIDKEKTVVDTLYNESKVKTVGKVIELPALVQWNQPTMNHDNNGLDRKQSISVFLQKDRIEQDFGMQARVGDFIEYNDLIFEVTTVISDTPFEGSSQLKYIIQLTATVSRQNQFLRQVRTNLPR